MHVAGGHEKTGRAKDRMELFMGKIAVVNWSGTGNTEAMAVAVAEGVREKGAEVFLMQCSGFDVARMM